MKTSFYQSIYERELSLWWYRARHLLAHWIIRKFTPAKNLKILDVGCGTGAFMHEMAPYGEVWGVDMSDTALDFCRERGLKNLKKADGTSLPFADNEFDLVLALDVLEHVEDDAKAASEISRVLKPGGAAMVFVPTFMILWSVTDILAKHFRRYRMPDLKRLLSGSGLRIIRTSYFNTFLFLPILAVRLFVRIFKIRMGNENDLMNTGLKNGILFQIFRSEIFFLKFMSFPFGVSAFVVARK